MSSVQQGVRDAVKKRGRRARTFIESDDHMVVGLYGEGEGPRAPRRRRAERASDRMNDEIAVQGVWLRRIGDEAQVLVQIEGNWRLCAKEPMDGNFSHIVEPSGIVKAPVAA
jgi:hypothetical protein